MDTTLASDGLYPELIALFRAVAKYGSIEIEELIRICSADNAPRAALMRWTDIGLFFVQDKTVQIDKQFAPKRGESLESVTKRLPAICRKLILEEKHCLPIWRNGGVTEEGAGRTADFARGLAWTLAQDIYNFSDVSADAIEAVERQQMKSGKFIFLNKTRWPGLRSWARYLGFGVGDDRTFLIDPTLAVREELPRILNGTKAVPADVFLNELSVRLPVLDNGIYRKEVESSLNEETWRRVLPGRLWGRGRAVRQSSLQMRNPFCDLPQIERLLVAESIRDDRVRVYVDRGDWLDQTSELLAAGRLVTLTCLESNRASLRDALSALITNPIDAGYIRAYGRLQAVRQSDDTLEADIELLEAVQ